MVKLQNKTIYSNSNERTSDSTSSVVGRVKYDFILGVCTVQNLISSISYDQGEIINNILRLHVPSHKIDCEDFIL